MTGDRLRFGAYEALFELAAGGMATVYLARKIGPAGFERLVVMKRVHRHLLRDREFFDMLRDEARIASLIVHPNVVGVDDVVEAAGELLLAQPYVESVSLAALLRAARDAGERLSPAVVVRVLTDVLAGLHAAHEARDLRGDPLLVVHRDVSPHNVLVGTDGRSRLIDFGIAKAERRATQTKTGVMKGKLAYMAPEALRQAPLDRRADVFAAGVMLHEALTGRRLFDGEDEADVLLSVVITEIDPPSVVAPAVPPALDAPTLAALERSPADRTPTAADLLESLERALPPAPPREVAAVVERLCGEPLADVRARVREALDAPPHGDPGLAPSAAASPPLAADAPDTRVSRDPRASGARSAATRADRVRPAPGPEAAPAAADSRSPVGAPADPRSPVGDTEIAPRSRDIPQPVIEPTLTEARADSRPGPPSRRSSAPLSAQPRSAASARPRRSTFALVAAASLLVGAGASIASLVLQGRGAAGSPPGATSALPVSATFPDPGAAAPRPLSTDPAAASPVPTGLPGASAAPPRRAPPPATSELHKNPYATP